MATEGEGPGLSGLHASLHVRLAEELHRKVIAPAQAGTRLPGMHQLAKQLGVSVNTVRAACIVLQEQGLVRIRHGSGCYVAEPPQGNLANEHVAVLVECDLLEPRISPFFGVLTRRTRQLLRERGVRSRLYLGEVPAGATSTKLTCEDFLEDAAAGRIHGVIAIATLPFLDWVQPLRARGVPLVGMTAGVPGYDVRVQIDVNGLLRDGVRLLAQDGCTSAGLLGWGVNPDAGGSDVFKFFEQCCAEHGVACSRDWVRTDLHPGQPGAGWEEFREIWGASAAQRPAGLVVADDLLMADVALAITELGIRVPEQLRIVAHANNGAYPRLPFPVAWLEFAPEAVAAALCDALCDLLAGDAPQKSLVCIPHRVCAPADNKRTTDGVTT